MKSRYSHYQHVIGVVVVSAALSATTWTARDEQQAGNERQFSPPRRLTAPLDGPILERCGNVGSWTVGARISPKELASVESDFSITAPQGIITSITVRARGMFTQRYVVIGDSTEFDVSRRYGAFGNLSTTARVGVSADGKMIEVDYPYEGIVFSIVIPPTPEPSLLFPERKLPPSVSPAPRLPDSRDRKVIAVRLHAKERDPSGADHSCNIK